METERIIKNWNAKKGTRFQIVSKDGDSAISRLIKQLGSTYGEAEIERYIYLNSNDENVDGDLWTILDSYKVKEWLEQNKKIVEVEAKQVEEPKQETSILNALGSEIVKIMGVELANNISKEVENKINEFIQGKVLTKVVEYKGEQKKVNGLTHEQFDTILKFVAMDEPVMLVGPAGTGKNVIAKQVAEALGLEFYFSNAVTQEYKITGYGDANGKFVETQFYKAFVNGGLFLLDEMDASCPEALIILNCAIANKYFDFPVIGRVEANPNFRVMACANTFGTGASLEYVGRNQLDGATLNRFALVEVNYDKRIEDNVCPDLELADFCRDFRKANDKNGTHTIVSYREMSRLYKMINVANLDKTIALKTCLIKGLENDTLRMLLNDIKDSEYKNILKNIIK